MADKTTGYNGTTPGETLIGKVTVQPETVVPGQPVLVQVLDPTGKLISDPTITVNIQGVPLASRYYQFAAVGSYNLFVTAKRGALTETARVAVKVAGKPLEFRKALTVPRVTEIPILKVATTLGQSYSATFSLGITRGARRLAASAKISASRTFAGAESDPSGNPPVITKAIGTPSIVVSAVADLRSVAESTSYHWDFGDGKTVTTEIPVATHDYFPAIRAGDITRGFDVTCTIVHDNVTIKRTLALHSAYGLCRRTGIVVPPVTSTGDATFQHIAFSASLIVHNLEASPITLNAAACVPFSDNTTVVSPAPSFTKMGNPLILAAESAVGLGVFVTLAQLQIAGAVVNGFTMYYSGDLKDSGGRAVPVRFSYTYRIPLSDSGLTNAGINPQLTPSNWDLSVALKAVTEVVAGPKGAVSKAGGQAVDSATNTIAIELSANPSDLNTRIRVRAAVQAGLTGVALKNGALSDKGTFLPLPRLPNPKNVPPVEWITLNPLAPPPVVVGNDCYPDDISDADLATATSQQLVCQLTTDSMSVTMPSQFQNAQQGDIILSPAPVGSGDLIAALFSALTPPQHHSHSGIITANFLEITHCTSSAARTSAGLNTWGTLGISIPTSINFDRLQYGWPGSIVQSIDDATGSVYLNDPSGTAYQFHSFDTDSQGDGFEIIPPIVVKPLPENEMAARPLLRKAADTARSKGAQYQPGGTQAQPGSLLHKGNCYYSFYAYTDAQLSAGFTDAAGTDTGWAQGLSPAVCSSFVWLCLKENNIPLVTKNKFETLLDFSQNAIAEGAQVGSSTLDGLIFYPQAERASGGEALYQMFLNQALNQEGGFGLWFGGAINDAVAGPLANQLLNNFAFGDSDLHSDAWRTPGDGNAVSPDNIILWNPPYFGYAEPLQYLPKHTEQYTVSKWNKVISWGTVKGTVRYNGVPVANVHVWVFNSPGGDTKTKADGSYFLNHIPIGEYALKAQGVVSVDGVQAELANGLVGQPITLSKDKPDVVQDINLQGLPESFRRADIRYYLTADHSDRYRQTVGVQTEGWFSNSVDVNPGNKINMFTFSYDYNGGGYYNVAFVWVIELLNDNSLQVTFNATMNSDNTSSDMVNAPQLIATVPVGKMLSYSNQNLATYSYDGLFTSYTNGPVTLRFTVANNQQNG